MELLLAAQKQWAGNPLVLLNLALVALQRAAPMSC
jgi:hypothetical protein